MGRTAALAALAGVVVAWSWVRLEHGSVGWDLLLALGLIGIAPALLPHRALRLAAVPFAVVGTLWHVFDTLRPNRIWAQIEAGFLLYYDVALPFSRPGQPLMHALVVVAILGFTLAISLAIAERRAILAAALLVAATVWPATLLTSSNTTGRGAVILAAALVVLGGLSATGRARQVALASALVIAAGLGAAAMPAVAKGAFLAWEKWEPTKEDLPVTVRYVWDTTYGVLDWPEKKTTVFEVEAPPLSRYWRATVLDEFNDGAWFESNLGVQTFPYEDPLLPAAARNSRNQIEAKFEIKALQDTRLLGASVPVRYDPGELGSVLYDVNGGASVQGGFGRGAEYTTWSYNVRPAPRRLNESRPRYSDLHDRFLMVDARRIREPVPAFGTPNREAAMDEFFAEYFSARWYRDLYDAALEVAGDAPTPYAAAVALENWLRDSGDFTYREAPQYSGNEPILVEFVTTNRAGYCQHFAGAMALMLRYLGIPARVAAGFTSGSYDQEDRRWTVTDHNAHLWVEVWFRGFGWIPFDPTPGRGQLDGAYSTSSVNFNPLAVAAALAATPGAAGRFQLQTGQFEGVNRPDRGQQGDAPGDLGGGSIVTDPEESLLRLLALIAVVLLTAIATLKLALRRGRYLTSDPRKLAAACRRELADYLVDQRVSVPESATVTELGELVRRETAVDPERFVEAVDAARYGPAEDALAAARRARRELRRVERLLRSRLSTWERVRGLVSLRSLGLTGG